MGAPPRRRRSTATLQPRVTLGLLYLLAFFFLFCLALVAPELIDVARTVPVGPEQEQAAREAARAALGRPRLLIALGLAAAATAVGISRGWLPGTRAPR